MHIARVGERLPRLQIQFWISRSFRPRNLANLRSKIRFWIRRKEHTLSMGVFRFGLWTPDNFYFFCSFLLVCLSVCSLSFYVLTLDYSC